VEASGEHVFLLLIPTAAGKKEREQMQKTKISIVDNKEIEIPICPNCGGNPVVASTIQKYNFNSDMVTHQEVTCPYCGLSAPFDVWFAVASAIQEPVSERTEKGAE
jgi:hypothetical protein